MAATVLSRFSYPKVPGDALWSVADMSGPASYAVVVPGGVPGGGQLMHAADFGLQSLDWVVSMGSNNGAFSVVCYPAPFNIGNALSAVILQWIDAASGAEVAGATNLSAFTVRLLAIGR